MARPDLLRPATRLVSSVAKWSPSGDTQLNRLVCEVWSTLDDRQEGYSSQQDAHNLQIAAYSDAAFTGCVETMRSTCGGHLCLEGPSSRVPIHALAKRPASAASSTPEAELVADDTVVRSMSRPCVGYLGHITATMAQSPT